MIALDAVESRKAVIDDRAASRIIPTALEQYARGLALSGTSQPKTY